MLQARRLHRTCRLQTAASASGAASTSGADGAVPGSRGKVLVLPAYYTDSQAFLPFVKKLRAMGYEAVLPPIRWYNWVRAGAVDQYCLFFITSRE